LEGPYVLFVVINGSAVAMGATCIKGHIITCAIAEVYLFQSTIVQNKAFVSTRSVHAAKDVVKDPTITYRLARVAISHIYVTVVKDVVAALYFHDTVLIDYPGIIKDFAEVENERTAYKLHRPDLVLGVN
jgi:hypothetical protein